jgi:hypothetical protein
MNAKYHGRLEHVFSRRDRATRLTMVFASLVGAGAALYELNSLAAGAMVLTMLLAFVTLTAQWFEKTFTHTMLRREWMSLRTRLETFERRVELMSEHDADALFEDLLMERQHISGHEPPSPDRRLLERMLTEVECEMGLDQLAINGTPTT